MTQNRVIVIRVLYFMKLFRKTLGGMVYTGKMFVLDVWIFGGNIIVDYPGCQGWRPKGSNEMRFYLLKVGDYVANLRFACNDILRFETAWVRLQSHTFC